jgi:beta-lactam-binding protein with PASTA domain
MRNVKILIAMIAVFLLVVPAAFAQVKPPQPVPVPNVVNMPLNAAQKALVAAGYNAVVTQENVTDPSKNNVVLKQQIAAGTTLAKGSNVPVVVGRYTAPAQQPVPNVVGMKLGEAQTALSKAKLNASVTMQPVAEPQRNDVVLTQQIAAGKTLSPGSMVPIVVGKYTAPAQQPVPNVVGMKLGEAQAALSKAKLNASVTMQPVSESQRNDVVLTQQIAAGKTLSPGSMVPIVVGKYTAPAPAPVPNVVGMKLGEAQAALSKVKLNAAVTMQPVDQPQRNDVVLTQQIAAGKTLSPGSTVPIVVGKYTAPIVPNVTGMSLTAAQQTLAAAKLNAVVTMEKVTDKNKNSIVLKQQIAPGSALTPGGQVPLIVGQYQEPVRVPSIVGMTEKQAETALKQANLKINSGGRTVANQRQVGTVLDQNPAPGTAVEPGSQVMFTVGLDPKAKIVLPQNNRPYPDRPYLNPAIPADKQN